MQAIFSLPERGHSAVNGQAVSVGLAGFATARAEASQFALLRKNPGLPADKPLPPGFLKNSDDQTVLGVAAIGRAMVALGRPTASYAEWGVVAAANLFGRHATLQGFLDFRKDGAWGITPHMIPHHSLHAVSGTVSQLLHLHGPNFGISGGPKAVAEAFLVAATLISENNLPGLWVVLSGHDPEYIPAGTDGAPCLAAALALEPLTGAFGSSLQIGANGDGPWPEFTLGDFLSTLETEAPGGHWSLPGCGWVRIESAGVERLGNEIGVGSSQTSKSPMFSQASELPTPISLQSRAEEQP